MKINKFIYRSALAAVLGFASVSCGDFLDKPGEDQYNNDNFYANDAQCNQGVYYLYNSPWYDFQRGFIKVGEVMSGNMYWGSSPYLTFTLQGTDTDLTNMSASLWSVIGHCNQVYNNIAKAEGPSVATKNATMGECLTLKALAYFFLVRTFGDVPLIHDNTAELEGGSYNDINKVEKADIYEYIIMTLEKAMELLPPSADAGRIDYYCAEGLLAKVYLTRAGLGMQGSRNEADLQAAARYAKDVIDNSGRHLLDNYGDVFRLANNKSEESLIAWRWTVNGSHWTRQNTLQSDLAPQGFDENGDCWGGWVGPSVDLQDAFGVSPLDEPSSRIDVDTRRKECMMLPGDVYPFFWQDKGGFDVLRFCYDSDYGKGGPGQWQCGTGSYNVKHCFGNNADHEAGIGVPAQHMANSLATHILRLSDVYLIYAEAVLGNNASTTDASALKAFNDVRSRAIPTATPKTSITFDDVWKERRLELAGEGDRWYDYVRRSYYDMDACIAEIKAQRRNTYWNLDALYKYYYETGQWDPKLAAEKEGAGEAAYDKDTPAPNVTASSFTIPFPNVDVVQNPHLMEAPIHVDVRATYSY